MIKISFSGFSGSGKTSILAEVKKILSLKYKVESIDEVEGKNPFDCDKKSCFTTQFFLMSTQINEENIKAMTGADYLLCDQSVLDQWVKWNSYIAGKEMTPQLKEKHTVLKELFHLWIKTYDLVFLIRMDLNRLEKRDSNNQIGITDVDRIKQIDELYKSIIHQDEIKVIETWNNATIDESAHNIIKFISESREKEAGDREEIENPVET